MGWGGGLSESEDRETRLGDLHAVLAAIAAKKRSESEAGEKRLRDVRVILAAAAAQRKADGEPEPDDRLFIRPNRVYRVLEGPRLVHGLAVSTRRDKERYAFAHFEVHVVGDDGIRRHLFSPNGEMTETDDLVVIRCQGDPLYLDCKLLVFKRTLIANEIGVLLLT